MEDVIDLQRYPLDRLDSEAGQVLVKKMSADSGEAWAI